MNLQELDATPPQHVVEAALSAISSQLDIDDPQTAAERLRSLAPQIPDTDELEALVRRASEEATDDLVDLLRLVVSTQDGSVVDEQELRRAFDQAGRRQLVITPDMLYMAALLALCGLAMLRNPKLSERRRVTLEEDKNGKQKMVIDHEVKYFNPFSPLVKLVQRVLGGDDEPSA